MAVTKHSVRTMVSQYWGFVFAGVLGFCLPLMAEVLPEDRADAMYHSFSGGGLDVSGPSILVRKSLGKHTSIWGNYYVDSISSATIDVVTSASKYNEERIENTLGIDYLHDNSTMGLSYTVSKENDFNARSINFNISQLMFGDLTTVSLGYARGSDTIGKTGSPDFEEIAERYKYKLALSQVLSKNMLMDINFETITDEGYLNNPYRFYRYLTGPGSYAILTERYPNTRTSHAVSIRALYYLPYRAVVHAQARGFTDSWGINARVYEIGYTHPIKSVWILDIKYRHYIQSQASFYSDLFNNSNEFVYLARDKELSAYTTQTIGLGVSRNIFKNGWGFIDKGSVNIFYDHIQIDYENFRDLRVQVSTPGTEPLYRLDANELRAFVSIWY